MIHTSIWANPVFKDQAMPWAIHWFQSKLLFFNLEHMKNNILWLNSLIVFQKTCLFGNLCRFLPKSFEWINFAIKHDLFKLWMHMITIPNQWKRDGQKQDSKTKEPAKYSKYKRYLLSPLTHTHTHIQMQNVFSGFANPQYIEDTNLLVSYIPINGPRPTQIIHKNN